MWYSRLLALLGLMGATAIGAALVIRNQPARSQPVRAAATVPERVKRTLRQELHQLLVAHPPVAHQPAAHLPGLAPAIPGQTCFVGPGSCSLTPCVIPVQRNVPTAVAVSSAARTPGSSAVPVASAVATAVPASSAPAILTLTHAPARLAAPASSCQRRGNVPQVLRVVGRP